MELKKKETKLNKGRMRSSLLREECKAPLTQRAQNWLPCNLHLCPRTTWPCHNHKTILCSNWGGSVPEQDSWASTAVFTSVRVPVLEYVPGFTLWTWSCFVIHLPEVASGAPVNAWDLFCTLCQLPVHLHSPDRPANAWFTCRGC